MVRFFLTALACTALAVPALAQSSMSGSSMKPTCAAGDSVVWVNTASKTYYMAGSSMYGKSSGKYACASAAKSMGMKPAKTSMMSSPHAMTSPGTMASPAMNGSMPSNPSAMPDGPASMTPGSTSPGGTMPSGAPATHGPNPPQPRQSGTTSPEP